MKTKITNIKQAKDNNTGDKYFIIYFMCGDEERFTYINKRSIQFWKAKGLNKLKVGLLINVSKISEKHFKIIGFENVSF